MRLLLVEDYETMRRTIASALKRSGYAVDHTGNGSKAYQMASDHSYDGMILDIMIPQIDGITLLKAIRQSGNETPAMFLTAKANVSDLVTGLRSGADDYLVKPFDFDELLARVEVLCRKRYQKADPVIHISDLEIDTSSKKVVRDKVPLTLTAREYAIVEYLALRQGQVVSRTEIEEHIYDDLVTPMSNVVDAAIYTLRKKLVVRKGAAPLIHTRRGQGYILEAPE